MNVVLSLDGRDESPSRSTRQLGECLLESPLDDLIQHLGHLALCLPIPVDHHFGRMLSLVTRLVLLDDMCDDRLHSRCLLKSSSLFK